MNSILKNGAPSVSSSGKPFPAVVVDVALEQPMNANVKNQFQGIMKYVDVSKAVKRWTVTNYTKYELGKSLLDIYSI